MPRALAISLFAVLAVLSLGLKLAGWGHMAGPDIPRLNGDLVRAMERQGYAAQLVKDDFSRPYVVAQRAGCRIAVSSLLDAGAEASVFGELQHWPGGLWFGYRGAWLASPPRFAAMFDHYAQRFGGAFGLVYAHPPLLAAYAGKGCDLAPLDLSALRQFPEPGAQNNQAHPQQVAGEGP